VLSANSEKKRRREKDNAETLSAQSLAEKKGFTTEFFLPLEYARGPSPSVP
jgi:hypothetical protein